MTIELILPLIVFAAVSSGTPGPNNLMLLASGANFGLKRTLPHMLGVSMGHAFMVFLVGVGLKQIFDAYPLSYLVLKILSTVYLLYLAWKIASNRSLPKQNRSTGTPLTFLQAAAFQWVNPKAISMAFSAVTIYAPPAPRFADIVIIALCFLMVNLPAVSLWAILGQQMSQFLNTPKRLKAFNITAGLLLVGTLYPILKG
ncbi:MAG: hypothetical protein CSA68_00700 [Rhodobacterales bacterium]|nr:MAG: hypothetical protein CSA68_00700 [Rhodobacterales bacterium]